MLGYINFLDCTCSFKIAMIVNCKLYVSPLQLL
uniref:Uncharacterized protein n=1 Tax=Arundo donax TaxID=35708 RepID=A0A0A8XRB8_ARUDO